MSVFALMDEWIAAAGETDQWLSAGLGLLDSWQSDASRGGQRHLAGVLSALHRLRPARPGAPDPVALAAWFHHAGAAATYDLLGDLAEQRVVDEVARLVRVLGDGRGDRADADGALLCAAHRAATPASHLAAVPRPASDQ